MVHLLPRSLHYAQILFSILLCLSIFYMKLIGFSIFTLYSFLLVSYFFLQNMPRSFG